MASSAKKKTTMAKRNRENAVREKRVRKQVRKDARKQAAADALIAPPEETIEADEAGEMGEMGEPTADER